MTIHIQSLSTTAGFLKEAPVVFSPGLTCIIGARGTCKSTLVETIRFLFDLDPKRVERLCSPCDPNASANGNSTQGLIHATLQGGVAKCIVTKDSPTGRETLSVERELDAEPRVYRDGIQELVERSVLHNIEMYSQGDLQRIAEDEALRLELIDRPNKSTVSSLQKQRNDTARELCALGPRIRAKAMEIEARRADVRGLDSLRSQLSELQSQRPQLSRELDTEREEAMKRKSLLEKIQHAKELRDHTCNALRESLDTGVSYASIVAELRRVNTDSATQLADTLDRFAQFRDALVRELSRLAQEDMEAPLRALQTHFEELNARYYRLRQEQQEVNDALKREDTLKRQITHIEKLQQELDQFLDERRLQLQNRSELRIRLQQIADQIYQLRQQEVERINSRHGDVVVLTLQHGARSTEYADRLSSLLQGSRLRNQDDVARDLAANIRPCDLIEIVEAADSQRLSTLLSRDLGQMARLVSFLMDKPQLYELEGMVFEDRLEITMYDRETPKPVNQLSKGQMATALLPLILRPASYPLIFDQPEDDLDNSFIYDTLVKHIQSLKQERQLIFVTHNANIPVLGDADSVIVMDMQTPTQAAAPTIGSVDDVKRQILTLLEGGSEAFQRRQEKYQSLLTKASA